MMMWPGLPRCSSDSRSRALLVVGHPILIVLWFGNSLFSSKNFPFESIRRTISHLCCLVGGDACSGGCCCLRGRLRSLSHLVSLSLSLSLSPLKAVLIPVP